MTPIIVITQGSGDIGKSLVNYAYEVLEIEDDIKKTDTYYIEYDYNTSDYIFCTSLIDTIFLAHSVSNTKEYPNPTIIILADHISKVTRIIEDVVINMKYLEIVFIPTIDLPLFLDIFYKRLIYGYITNTEIKQSIDYISNNITAPSIIINGERNTTDKPIKIKYNNWNLEATDNAIVAKMRLTVDELGHELLTNNQILETDEYYLVPEKNENGHIVFYKVLKD